MLLFLLVILGGVSAKMLEDEETRFGYNTGNVVREETRGADGATRGFYDYIDPNGMIQHVEYVADSNGFRVRATNLPIHVVQKSG